MSLYILKYTNYSVPVTGAIKASDLTKLSDNSRVYKAGPSSKFIQKEADFFEELATKLDDEIVMPDKNLASVIDGFSKKDGKRYELKVMSPGGNLGTKIDNFISDMKSKRRSLENDGRFPKTNVYGKLDGHSRSDIISRWNDLKHKLGEKGEYLDEIFIYAGGDLIKLD